jgi:hypothetical protein
VIAAVRNSVELMSYWDLDGPAFLHAYATVAFCGRLPFSIYELAPGELPDEPVDVFSNRPVRCGEFDT